MIELINLRKDYMNIRYFTSESVCSGHPDKIADGISDLLLDELIKQDSNSRTGIETVVGDNQIVLLGEIKSKAKIDFETLTRQYIKSLGYTKPEWGFSDQSNFSNYIHQQSPEIAVGVDNEGAGDQGMMFGYACNETVNLMPLPISIAHSLTKKIDELRQLKTIDWLRPDGKAQVTIKYENDVAVSIEKLVLAVAHSENKNLKDIKKIMIDQVINPVLAQYKFKAPTERNIIVNGTGLWFIPGPASDAGLTGRKIVVDGYGGYSRVGGGAFSGKDPSKVDRSGAYAARYIAKNIVGNGLADRCEVALAYVIGRPKPLMLTFETFGTSKVSDKSLFLAASSLIDLSVQGIIEQLNLKRPIYSSTTNYGHFGKKDLAWEEVRELQVL